MNTNPKYTQLSDENGKPQFSSYATYMHPNPRFYKYYWRVFHHDMPEGKAFFATPCINTFKAMNLIKKLEDNGKGYMIYNWHLPRTGKDVPFDFDSDKWFGSETALPFDEDSDPQWRGHK